MVNEIEERLRDSDAVFLASYKGLKASDFNDIRWELKDLSAEIMVVKNRLFNRAVKELYDIDISKDYTGEAAMTICNGDPAAVVKHILKIGKKAEYVDVKLGIMNKEVLDTERIKFLSTLPGREVLIAKAVGAISSPITGFVFVLKNVISSLVNVIKNIEDQKKSS